ncbi:MAG: ferritin-like domain-containing protein [Deltaproteobacteria bacterium]|nr:ferritin-like domain-containing protein [Deltaproteobacteria bacterium]
MKVSKIVGTVVLGSGLTVGCMTTGETTLVVPMAAGSTCEQACAASSGGGESGYQRIGEVLECVPGTYLPAAGQPAAPAAQAQSPDPAAQPSAALGSAGAATASPVAVCRMRTHYTGGIGRRPEGLVLPDAIHAPTSLGALFAEMAHLEAASVVAFERLARELSMHGAPDALVRRARRAAADEVRHAAVASRWREHFGGSALPLEMEPVGEVRSLVEVASENAAEGCVHETWGAVVTTLQSARASDAAVRAELARIARDERRHADLADDVARWAEPLLSARDRLATHAAACAALEELGRSVGAQGSDCAERAGGRDAGRAARWLGLPTGDEPRLLFAHARSALWQSLVA